MAAPARLAAPARPEASRVKTRTARYFFRGPYGPRHSTAARRSPHRTEAAEGPHVFHAAGRAGHSPERTEPFEIGARLPLTRASPQSVARHGLPNSDRPAVAVTDLRWFQAACPDPDHESRAGRAVWVFAPASVPFRRDFAKGPHTACLDGPRCPRSSCIAALT